jgi:uncharacterized membrane protein YfcA
MPLYVSILLGLTALAAGFIDAIAGGGGLLTLPALLLTGMKEVEALATNKGQSVFGSGMALLRYYHSPLLNRRRALYSFPGAFAGSIGGAALALHVSKNPQVFTPMIIAMLFAVALFMIFYRPPRHHVAKPRGMPTAVAIAMLIGFYDGFIGPGTGTFLIMAYVLFFADAPDAASANAKVANFASNLGALLFFLWSGNIKWEAAIPMAIGQAVGGFIGAHVTIRGGGKLVRIAAVIVSLALICTLIWKTFAPWKTN